MSKKKNSKSVFITVVVTVVVLTVLTLLGVKYLLPIYVQNQGGAIDLQFTIYSYAIRLFPLLIGIVLIVIASMIASNRKDEYDEEDLLPPNSYDQQLFENPSDDPVRTPRPAQPQQQPAEAPKQEPVVPETVKSEPSDDDFFAIFNEPEPIPEQTEATAELQNVEDDLFGEEPEEDRPVEEPVEPVAEEPVVEEAPAEEEAVEEEPAVEEPIEDPFADTEEEPAEEPAEEAVEEPVAPVQDDRLLNAVNALSAKIDDLMSDEEEDEEEYEEEEDLYDERLTTLENKIEKLTEAIAKLTEAFSNQAVAPVVAAAVVAPAQVEEPEPEPVPEPIEEPVEATAPVEEEEPQDLEDALLLEPIDEPEPEPEPEEPKEVKDGDEILNDIDPNDPVSLMKVEFDSAQENVYDITYAFTDKSIQDVVLSMGDVASTYEANGHTVICIPFLSKAEADAELEKGGFEYDSVFVEAGEKAEFDDVVGAKLA